MRSLLILPVLILSCFLAPAQISTTLKSASEEQYIRAKLNALTDTNMHGRGYVANGKENAADYIQSRFKELKMRGITKDGSYAQNYYFPVNTFPGKMKLAFNGEELTPGEDYLIDPTSISYYGRFQKVVPVDLKQIVDTASWIELANSFKFGNAYYFEEIETVCKNLNIKPEVFPYILPHGIFIIKADEKLTWSLKMDTGRGTIFYVKESAIPKKWKTVDVDVINEYQPKCKNQNIVGIVPGRVRDTFIAISAHYDHLGMMGGKTTFPGASDNASGVAFMLYLASYFAAHPQKYSVMFIAFSGEEAELIGSRYFSKHPVAPLGSIKFLMNVDLMGDATNGITVVNGAEFKKEFDELVKINTRNKYISAVNPRGKAANSDQYYLTEAGVPGFFIYSNGGPGFYHDIYDKPGTLSLNQVGNVAKLVIDFLQEFSF